LFYVHFFFPKKRTEAGLPAELNAVKRTKEKVAGKTNRTLFFTLATRGSPLQKKGAVRTFSGFAPRTA
jgi:hypothetical protein